MKILITGADGQLGNDLVKTLKDFEVIPLTHPDMDITDINSVKPVSDKYKPDIIINTAAYVQVDECETHPDKAFLVNAIGARNMAVVAEALQIKLVHISTDYVFGGAAERQTVSYTEFDAPAPLNIYGQSKLAGEDFIRHLCHRHFVVRTSGLFGVAGSSGKGGNFVETILNLDKERNELKVVNDQIFSPTYTVDLARKVAQLLHSQYYGVFHITNRGLCSWYEFAVEILRMVGSKTRITPITSDQYPQKARRPHFSGLDNYQLRLLGMDDMRSWQEALRNYLEEKGYTAQTSSRKAK